MTGKRKRATLRCMAKTKNEAIVVGDVRAEMAAAAAVVEEAGLRKALMANNWQLLATSRAYGVSAGNLSDRLAKYPELEAERQAHRPIFGVGRRPHDPTGELAKKHLADRVKVVRAALKATGWVIQAAAEKLGIHHRTLRRSVVWKDRELNAEFKKKGVRFAKVETQAPAPKRVVKPKQKPARAPKRAVRRPTAKRSAKKASGRRVAA